MNLTPRHTPFERLADLAEGRLSAAERDEVRAHLAGCRRCAARAAQIERVTHLMHTDAGEDAPAAALANVLRMFRPHAAAARAAQDGPSLVRRLLAALTFDSARLAPAHGVRAGAGASARQLLFNAGDVDVDLRLSQGGEGWTVTGQVLGRCEAGGRAELLSLGREGEGQTAAHAGMNEQCEFALPAVAAGDYALRLRLGDDLEVEIPELSLRA